MRLFFAMFSCGWSAVEQQRQCTFRWSDNVQGKIYIVAHKYSEWTLSDKLYLRIKMTNLLKRSVLIRSVVRCQDGVAERLLWHREKGGTTLGSAQHILATVTRESQAMDGVCKQWTAANFKPRTVILRVHIIRSGV